MLEQSWTRDEDAASAPKYTFTFSFHGISFKAAYQHDEAALDGEPTRVDLAFFVHTCVPDDGVRLYNEAPAMDKNMATRRVPGGDDHPQPDRQKRPGKDQCHPNIVFSANAQVALEKFAGYWDVEARMIPVNRVTSCVMKPEDAIQCIDEKTIEVMVIVGSTYNGAFEDVGRMSSLQNDLQERTGLDIPIHVDAAGAGFIAPRVPQLQVDLRPAARYEHQRLRAQIWPCLPRA